MAAATVLLLCSFSLVYATVVAKLEADLGRMAAERLKRSIGAAGRLLRMRVEALTQRYAALARDPRLVAALQARDRDAGARALAAMIADTDASRLELLDGRGSLVAAASPLAQCVPSSEGEVQRTSFKLTEQQRLERERRVRLAQLGTRPWRVVPAGRGAELALAVPVRADDRTVGTLRVLEPLGLELLEGWSHLCGARVEPPPEREPPDVIHAPLPEAPALLVCSSIGPERGTVRRTASLLALSLAFALALAFPLSHVATRRLAREVEHIREVAARIGAGDLEARTGLAGSDEIGQIGQALDAMAAQLQRNQRELLQATKMRALGEVASGVVHDFNNLIAVIGGFCDLARASVPAPDELGSYLDEIERAAAQAQRLTRELLAFARGRQTGEERTDVCEVLRDSTTILQRALGEHAVLELTVAARPGPVRLERGRFEQLLLNLVTNARDAIVETGRKGRVRIELEAVEIPRLREDLFPPLRPGSYARLAVRDTGCGMDAATRDKIFEPFFTTKADGRGSGIGLATVLRIVTDCAGAVGVASSPGRGTRFEIYLPTTAAGSGSTPQRNRPVAAAG